MTGHFAATGLGNTRKRSLLKRSSCQFEEEETPTLAVLPDVGEEKATDDESGLDYSTSEEELQDEPPRRELHRRGSVSAEAYGAWNARIADWKQERHPKEKADRDTLLKALKAVAFFKGLDEEMLILLVDAMPIVTYETGDCVVKQGDKGDSAFVILHGQMDCFNEDAEMTMSRKSMAVSMTNSPKQLVKKREFIRVMEVGRLFGEMAMLWGAPRSRSVYASEPCKLARLSREAYQNIVVRRSERERELRVDALKKASMFETLGPEEIAKIADAMEKRQYRKDDYIVQQGQEGDELFVILSGECVVTVHSEMFKGETDKQEYRSLGPGDLFGEIALLKRTLRTANIQARTNMEVLCITRGQFERMFGKLDKLQQKNYMSDPRRSLAEFYRPGNIEGPKGVCKMEITFEGDQGRTDWFAVYRPTSRDAIAKMLGGIAVGKGLNVKGKSAKRNRLSGFVPFLQISDNSHKCKLEPSPADARLKIFYRTEIDCKKAMSELEPILKDKTIEITDRVILQDDSYVHSKPPVWGLDMPEPVMREAYIMRPDLSFLAGWETGRASEPAFMDMNLHAVRSPKPPKVVLYQWDADNPMNPQGLLIAYAESCVKPVVSDFDTFTVGSRGMSYEPLEPNQSELSAWSLEHTKKILQNPSSEGWCSRWLEVLREAAEKGFHPETPQYGFGDRVSYDLIAEVVAATSDTGAVRHGAECFNFFFPQELDASYLVVYPCLEWADKPWAYMNENELREFLTERVDEGYIFPMNPVWLVRDEGWYEIYEEMMEKEPKALTKWYGGPGSNIRQLVERMHKIYPEGFKIDPHAADTQKSPEDQKNSDLDTCERAALASFKAKGKLWRKIQTLQMLGCLGPRSPTTPKSGAFRSPKFGKDLLKGGVRLNDLGLAETGASPD